MFFDCSSIILLSLFDFSSIVLLLLFDRSCRREGGGVRDQVRGTGPSRANIRPHRRSAVDLGTLDSRGSLRVLHLDPAENHAGEAGVPPRNAGVRGVPQAEVTE